MRLASLLIDAAPLLLGLSHAGVAGWVSLHVLLHKRDVGAAISWIGLAWLSPFIGGLLYWMFGINRVRRRARRLRRPSVKHAHDVAEAALTPDTEYLEPLRRAATAITGRLAMPGNRLTILAGGDEAYPLMIAAIDAARQSIVLSSYIFRADAAGQPIIEALIRAQSRGVAIRVLIDGIGSGYFYSGALRCLRRGGVPAAQFLHSFWPWRMAFLNMRDHKKLLILDGAHAFTGGLNIGAENVQALAPRHPVRDTHFAVEGPVVSQLMEAFVQDWLFTTGERLRGAPWFHEVAETGIAVARIITSGPDQDLEKLELIILTAISAARDSIRIVTPYFLPDERLCSALALAAWRGVTVDIVVPESGNHVLVDWASRAQIRPMLDAGCRLWFAPPPFDHSKLMSVDTAWCLIGSANWDIRSFRLNFELNLEVYDPEFSEKLGAIITARLSRQVLPAELDHRGLAIRLRNAAARLMLPYL